MTTPLTIDLGAAVPQRRRTLRSTPNGVTWASICRSGTANPDSKIGVYAGDAESYECFWERFQPIIERCHNLAQVHTDHWHKAHDWHCPPVMTTLPVVCSIRIRVARNLANIPFPSAMRGTERQQLYHRVRTALTDVPGTWFELASMTPSEKTALAAAHLLFTNEDRFMASTHIFDHWPVGRAIFVMPDWQAAIWVNEEDHLRVMTLVPGYQPAAVLACPFLHVPIARLHYQEHLLISTGRTQVLTASKSLGAGIYVLLCISTSTQLADEP